MLNYNTRWLRVPIRFAANSHAKPVAVKVCNGHRNRGSCRGSELVPSRSPARRTGFYAD